MTKPQNAIALSSIPDADESFNTVMAQLKTTTENETTFPNLSFWFTAEPTLPKQILNPENPVTREVTMYLDFDWNCYSTWLCYGKKNAAG